MFRIGVKYFFHQEVSQSVEIVTFRMNFSLVRERVIDGEKTISDLAVGENVVWLNREQIGTPSSWVEAGGVCKRPHHRLGAHTKLPDGFLKHGNARRVKNGRRFDHRIILKLAVGESPGGARMMELETKSVQDPGLKVRQRRIAKIHRRYSLPWRGYRNGVGMEQDRYPIDSLWV